MDQLHSNHQGILSDHQSHFTQEELGKIKLGYTSLKLLPKKKKKKVVARVSRYTFSKTNGPLRNGNREYCLAAVPPQPGHQAKQQLAHRPLNAQMLSGLGLATVRCSAAC